MTQSTILKIEFNSPIKIYARKILRSYNQVISLKAAKSFLLRNFKTGGSQRLDTVLRPHRRCNKLRER